MALPSSAGSDGVTSGPGAPQAQWGFPNNIAFAVQQMLAKLQTATLVRIESCTNDGGVSPVGFVNVTPLVNQIDGQGNPTLHATIFNVPYFRLQGGANAVIMDPAPGDIGIAVFASRDITKVKATKKQGNPGSYRQYSFADALYIGGVLNGTPQQYIRFHDGGISVKTPVLTVDGDVIVTGDVTAGEISLRHHTHGGVSTGGSNTGEPN